MTGYNMVFVTRVPSGTFFKYAIIFFMLDSTCTISKHLSKLEIKLCSGLICIQ